MKTLRVKAFGGPEVLEVVEVELPPLKSTDVAVAVRAIGVNPVDTYLRSGSNPALPLPYTPGFDAAGVVSAVGNEVRHVAPGDRVYVGGSQAGTYAEQVVCAAAQVYPLPAGLSFEQGAAIHIPYATAFRALFHRARARGGERVLVHGASGGVGLACVQLARAAGLIVFGTTGTDAGRELVLREGAHEVFDHRQPDHLARVVERTHGLGVEIILEMLANVNLGQDLAALAQRGRVVVIGSRGKVEITPRDAMFRDAAILGMTLFNVGPDDMASIHAALGAGFANGTLRPVIGRRFSLTEAARAHAAVLEPGALGKIVLLP
jgi:NADPH2:quinone reductase